jgi:hypothetical protein
MKALIIQFRLLVAEWLLGKAFDVSPYGKDGEEIKTMIAYYFDSKVKQM